jgi:hypothetical protein
MGVTSMECVPTSTDFGTLECKPNHFFVSQKKPEEIKKDLDEGLAKISSKEFSKNYTEMKRDVSPKKIDPKAIAYLGGGYK